MAEIVKVHGLEDLRRALRRSLPDHLHNKALQPALAKGAALIVAEARQRAPKRSGVLRRAIHQMRSRFSTRTRPSRIVRVRQGKKQQKDNRDAFYWRFIEFGHGVIRRKGGGVLGTPVKGWFGREIEARPARPFMRPAFEAKKFAAIEAFRAALLPEIQKVAERSARASAARLRGRVRGLIGI